MLGALCLCGLSACTENSTYTQRNNSDSETHWLEACDQDSDCGELSCICGVCTQPCQSDQACQADGGDALCIPSAQASDQCGAPPAQICWRGCQDNSDCAWLEGGVCLSGVCASADTSQTPEQLCQGSGGAWDEAACGHYRCGLPNECEAIDPGCDCGPGANFVDGQGCVEDDTCNPAPGDTNEVLCQDSGGTWDEAACGHYRCGLPNECEAIDPGCDCGEGRNFVDGQGCVADDTCGPAPGDINEALCQDSGGAWDIDTCGHYRCGRESGCLAIIPGCDCGEGRNFIEGQGCAEDDTCQQDTQSQLCEASGGSWDVSACGHYLCGLPNDCNAVIPGCDCGPGANFVDGQGCAEDDACQPVLDEQALCLDSGGAWDDLACGHYRCGVSNDCRAVDPGCDCGEGRNFVAGQGCVEDEACQPVGEEQALCQGSGGTWDVTSCGHYQCGGPPLCDAIIPGCDCGPLANFIDGQGCVAAESCQAQHQPDQEALCLGAGGSLDPAGCGHAVCGVAPQSCDEVQASCTCADNQVFVPARGCVPAAACVDQPGSEVWTVDPRSITFFSLPINSLRYAVAGYIPEARACVAAIWSADAVGPASQRLHCEGAGVHPYLHIELDQDGPCTNWGYSGNLPHVAPYEGCVDFGGVDDGVGINYADLGFTVQSDQLSGHITMTNLTQFAAPVPVGLRYNVGAATNLYLQARDAQGRRGWFRLKDAQGRRLEVDDPCGVPACGQEATACAPPQAEVLAAEGRTGLKMDHWDGYLRVMRPGQGCFERVAAWTWGGPLTAELCYGTGSEQADGGTLITGQRCIEVAVPHGASPAYILGTLPQ
jgi:hypothetical protein